MAEPNQQTEPEQARSSREYFDRVAPEWDQMRQSFFSEAVRDKAMAVAQLREGALAADIGAGTGFMTEGLLRAGLRVVAVDRSEPMLAVLWQKFPGQSLECRRGEAHALPLENESVDFVFANMYLHHVEDPAMAIREMARILRPGGRLVLTDLDEHQFEFLRTEQHDRWLGFKRHDIHQWFTEAGLRHVVVDCAGENCCAQSASGCEQASISIFVASGEKPGLSS